MMKNVFIVLFCLLSATLFGQEDRKKLREGNDAYRNGDYQASTEAYEQSISANPDNQEAVFNQGDALYRQQRFADAATRFERAAEQLTDPKEKAKAYHNLGNAYLEAKQYQNSIDAYKKSLRLNPNDNETRYNLSYAKKKLEDQQKQEQEQQPEEQEQEQQEQEQEQDENQEQEQEQEQEQQEPEPQENNEQQDEGEQPPQPDPQEQPASERQNARQILDALNDIEAQEQKKLKKEKTKNSSGKIEKDW